MGSKALYVIKKQGKYLVCASYGSGVGCHYSWSKDIYEAWIFSRIENAKYWREGINRAKIMPVKISEERESTKGKV